jgi:hypothetical protein
MVAIGPFSCGIRRPTYARASVGWSHHWARLRWAYGPNYATPYAYAIGLPGADRGIRLGVDRLCAAHRRWCAVVKLAENNKAAVVKTWLYLRSSSCDLLLHLVVRCRCSELSMDGDKIVETTTLHSRLDFLVCFRRAFTISMPFQTPCQG